MKTEYEQRKTQTKTKYEQSKTQMKRKRAAKICPTTNGGQYEIH